MLCKVAYRTFVIAGVRDPILLANIEEIELRVKEQVALYYEEIDRKITKFNFIITG